MNVSAVILAGGASRRMGSPKALLEYNGQTFIDNLIETFDPLCSEVVVVLGHEAEKVRAGIKRPARFVVNHGYERGQLSSLQTGLKHAGGDVVLFTPVDYPAFSTETVRHLLASFDAGTPVLAPRHAGKHGHPVLISAAVREELLALGPDGTARDVIHKHVRYIDVDDAGVANDIDEPSDYSALLKRATRLGLLALVLLLIAGIAAPFVRVDQYKEQIRIGLERALHRRVQIEGKARLNLFRGPGFSVEKVIIHDDPSVGIEPLANVPELQASLRLSSLWTGRIEIASVRFVEPSVNIVKPEQGAWNIVPLLGAAAQTGVRLPTIQVSDGRINFKFGDTKSAFYLTDTDMTISPRAGGFNIDFAGAPARTDRAGLGYGLFEASGRITGGEVDIDIELNKTSVEEAVTLVRGQSLGMHGNIASRAKISGPIATPGITGRFDVEDLHRWDVIPQSHTGVWSVNYKGGIDLAKQRLELTADARSNPTVPAILKLTVADALYAPNWTIESTIEKLPASRLIEAAHYMGTPLPAGLRVDGNAAGVLAYSSRTGVQGQMDLQNAVVAFGADREFQMERANIMVEGDQVRLLPATLAGKENAAQLEATYAPFRNYLDVQLTGKRLSIAELQASPLAGRFRGGTWTGWVRYVSDGEGQASWTAAIQVHDVATAVPGLASPVKLGVADIEIENERMTVRRMKASAGKVEFYGQYAYEPEEAAPHRFALWMPSAELAEIAELMKPTTSRQGGFLMRTLRLRRGIPEWLRGRRAEGTLRIGTLAAGNWMCRAFRSNVVWNGGTVELRGVETRVEEGAVEGSIVADLRAPDPLYTLKGRILNLPWKNGELDLIGELQMSGSGAQAEGKFEARNVAVSPDLSLRAASGGFDVAVTRSGPQVKLSGVQASVGTERFLGEGTTQADGRLHMELASATRVLNVQVAR